MKHQTYHLLKQAYLGHVDKHALLQSAMQEKDPFIQRAVQLVTRQTLPRNVPWNVQIFFRKGNPQERLEETFMAFFLRLAAIIKEEMHIRTFQKPESHAALHAWINMLKMNLYAVLTLLYKVEWKGKHYFDLEKAVFELIHEGKASALRHCMEHDLNIKLSTTTTMAEQASETLNFLTIAQFGSSFWRLLHWMELLMDPKTQYRQLWYNIHNKVTARKMEHYTSLGINIFPSATYSESELEQGVAFMHQALVP
ncbi:hypothetical protein AVEN_257675-1 [Araneus ventricosus]|uniref:Uncharacterized protein n=1 Tax=Araneus ventricosus TaxID=182803 RepID=A0A4Y2LEP1_ARAVE|nr:hypothetical protein AVEN_257675-1 [Araneus ventricosus]